MSDPASLTIEVIANKLGANDVFWMIGIGAIILIFAIVVSNRHGETYDRLHKKNVDAYTSMHHDRHYRKK